MTLTVSATDVAPDTLSYAFDWDNDGSFDDVNQPPTVSHIWDNQGDYDVGIRVTDKDGGRTLTTTAVSAFNEPPIAVALGPDGARFEGSAVYFSGQDSTDPGNLDVLSFNWNFGDGNSAQGVDVTHSYADNRVYSATLTVTDDSGAASSDSVAVTILNANPVADAGGDREVDEGVSLNFVGSATDPGTADTHTFDWDFSYDGVTFNPEAPGPSVSQTFPDGPATVQVALRVRDDDYQNPPVGGNQIGESIDTLQLTVKNVPPGNVKANGPYTGVEGRPVPMAAATATDVSSDTLTYEWDVNGDGTYDLNGQAVTYTWFTARSYSVTLRVRDDDGGSATDTTNVMITNGPPFADAGGPYTGSEGSPIVLDSSGTTDPSTPPDVLTYRWNFGDGSPGVITTSVTVRHTYADEGVYTATLDVDDGRGGTDTDIASVTVNNQPPAILSANATPNLAPEGSTVNFDAAATDPGVTDVLTYEWDFADGTPLGNGTPVTHLYSDDNLYVVALTVRDGDGGLVTTTIPVTITNVAPTAAFTTTAAPFREGIPIRFDSSSSSDPAGPSDPLTYAWDFGDGSAITSTTRVTITHVYPDNGVYTATLRVNDDDGGVGTARRALTIQNRPPVANAGGPYSTTIGITVTLTGSATDVPSDTLTYGWDLDDNGTYETPGRVTTVVFTATGSYTVTVRVTDDDGGVGTDSAIIQVNSVLPLAWPIIPYYLIRAMRAKWRKKKRRDKNKQK